MDDIVEGEDEEGGRGDVGEGGMLVTDASNSSLLYHFLNANDAFCVVTLLLSMSLGSREEAAEGSPAPV